MDRRSFLKALQATGSAAALAGVAASGPAIASPSLPTTPLRQDARRLTIVSDGSGDLPGPGGTLERMANRLARASDGRFGLAVEDKQRADQVDGSFGSLTSAFDLHPATAFFSGLPGSARNGLGRDGFAAWMASGGGQMHFDDILARYGAKPLLAGFTGVPSRFWFATPALPETFAGLRIAVTGLGADIFAGLGARPVALRAEELAPALADGRIDAVDVDGPLTALALGLPAVARSVATSGLHGAGLASALILRRDVWDGLTPAEQALLELVTGEATRETMTAQQSHAGVLAEVVRTTAVLEADLPASVSKSLEDAATRAIARIGAHDEDSARIAASYAAFAASLAVTGTATV